MQVDIKKVPKGSHFPRDIASKECACRFKALQLGLCAFPILLSPSCFSFWEIRKHSRTSSFQPFLEKQSGENLQLGQYGVLGIIHDTYV